MYVLHTRFWKVLRLWTTVCCWGSTTKPKQSGNDSLRARLQQVGTKRGDRLRDPCTPLRWSLYREAPHAETRWTTTTRKSPFHNARPQNHLTFTNADNVPRLSVVWVAFQPWVSKESASCCSLESLTSCSPTGRQQINQKL